MLQKLFKFISICLVGLLLLVCLPCSLVHATAWRTIAWPHGKGNHYQEMGVHFLNQNATHFELDGNLQLQFYEKYNRYMLYDYIEQGIDEHTNFILDLKYEWLFLKQHYNLNYNNSNLESIGNSHIESLDCTLKMMQQLVQRKQSSIGALWLLELPKIINGKHINKTTSYGVGMVFGNKHPSTNSSFESSIEYQHYPCLKRNRLNLQLRLEQKQGPMHFSVGYIGKFNNLEYYNYGSMDALYYILNSGGIDHNTVADTFAQLEDFDTPYLFNNEHDLYVGVSYNFFEHINVYLQFFNRLYTDSTSNNKRIQIGFWRKF